jgi:hypothetical protein
MKNSVLKLPSPSGLLLVAGLLGACCLTQSCKQKQEASTSAHNHEAGDHDHFACPMHPDQVGHEGEKCPLCGMDLEKVNAASSKNSYYMDFSSNPMGLRANEAATLSFTPKIKGNETAPVPLDIEHDKKMHLIVVSKDLAYFDHIHPEFQSSGNYDIKVLAAAEKLTARFANETRFSAGGDYVLFADYKPSGATHQVERIGITVEGTPYQKQSFTTERNNAQVDGYSLSLVPDGGKFVNEGTLHIAAIIKKQGNEVPASQLENYLGAKAHVVVISEDTQHYLHVHPEVVDDQLDLHANFGTAGVFRVWLQFKSEGQVHTADFTLVVEEGAAPESSHTDDGSHVH